MKLRKQLLEKEKEKGTNNSSSNYIINERLSFLFI